MLRPSWTTSKAPETAQPVALTPVLAPARAHELPPAQTITPQIDATPVQASDHPVPPGSIPEARTVPVVQEPAKVPANDRSRLSEIISDIPVVGRMVRRGE